MNEAKPLMVRWFAGQKGIVGIAKVQLDNGEIEYRIGAVDGFMKTMDVQQLVAWGVKFPAKAGEAVMTAKE